MAVSLSTGKVTFSTAWTQTNTVSGSNSSTQSGPYTSSVSPTISGAACNRVYFVQTTLTAGSTATIDVSTLTEPFFGTAISPVRIYSIHIKIATATGRYIPGAANALVFPFNDSSDAINFNAGDSFAHASTTATTVSGAAKNIRIINTAGAATLTYTVVMLLGV